ncbi:hypothetical protein LAX5112_03424 [Roseibium alexandrii]|uniref:Uncharacterized protein n=1 Tax=Roseibium alexandrii TaxID=388408 RepID=A0A0M7AD99_9HYPH|nr:hypothetical protein LAX5112_03424 [Roseibium alexandrii]
MRIDTALRNQFQVWQPLQQVRSYFGAFAKQDDGISFLEPFGKRTNVFDMIGPDCDLVFFQFLKTRQTAQRIEPVIQYVHFH